MPGYVPAIGERDLDKIIRAIRNIAEVTRAPTIQVFNASGTWTNPGGLSAALVIIWGGGGGGGGSGQTTGSDASAGGGGGSAQISVKLDGLIYFVSTFDAWLNTAGCAVPRMGEAVRAGAKLCEWYVRQVPPDQAASRANIIYFIFGAQAASGVAAGIGQAATRWLGRR